MISFHVYSAFRESISALTYSIRNKVFRNGSTRNNFVLVQLYNRVNAEWSIPLKIFPNLRKSLEMSNKKGKYFPFMSYFILFKKNVSPGPFGLLLLVTNFLKLGTLTITDWGIYAYKNVYKLDSRLYRQNYSALPENVLFLRPLRHWL